MALIPPIAPQTGCRRGLIAAESSSVGELIPSAPFLPFVVRRARWISREMRAYRCYDTIDRFRRVAYIAHVAIYSDCWRIVHVRVLTG